MIHWIRFLLLGVLLGWTGFARAGAGDAASDNGDGLLYAKLIKPSHHVEEKSVPNANLLDQSGTFVEIYSGYDYAMLGDIGNGFTNFKNYLSGPGTVLTGGVQNSGVKAGVRYGLHLDSSSSLALNLGTVMTLPSSLSETMGSTVVYNLNVVPQLYSVTLEYSLNLMQDPGSRTYVRVGGGFYHAAVGYDFVGEIGFGGTYTADNVGGTLDLGEEIALGSNFGLNFSAEGRYVTFSQLSSNNGANYEGGSQPSSLALVQLGASSPWILLPLSNAYINANPSYMKNAGLDYSGLGVNASVEYHFF